MKSGVRTLSDLDHMQTQQVNNLGDFGCHDDF
eukprot:SAG31_NODE_43201_length_268_cov_0.609467_1_plen_31_part_01